MAAVRRNVGYATACARWPCPEKACHDAGVGDDRFSVLWLCGQPGAGKSAVGWALYDGLAQSGVRAGFIDIDQLGIFLPAPLGDPERFRLKERNVAAVAANFRASGGG